MSTVVLVLLFFGALLSTAVGQSTNATLYHGKDPKKQSPIGIVKDVIPCNVHDHDHCRTKCKTLGPLDKEARCIEGLCHCGEIENLQLVNPDDAYDSHPTVKCEHLYPANGLQSAEKDELCLAHCHSHGGEYNHGECVKGVCHCAHQIHTHTHLPEGHATVKCEHIPSVNEKLGVDNEGCTAHCHSIGGGYVSGKCVEGICRCQIAVVLEGVVVIGENGTKFPAEV